MKVSLRRTFCKPNIPLRDLFYIASELDLELKVTMLNWRFFVRFFLLGELFYSLLFHFLPVKVLS